MSTATSPAEALAEFYRRELIGELLYPVKSGKEATVYCCRGGPKTGVPLLAAKIYHDRERRNFHNDAVYHEGSVILNGRNRRAAAKKSSFGREFLFGSWVVREWETLRKLYNAGADVPRPIAYGSSALLMEFVGDEDGPAPTLQSVHLNNEEAGPLLETLLRNIELWLACDRVHADLSPFNVLYHEGRITVIDFPQAVDPRLNNNARDLLRRDVENICRYFARRGYEVNTAWFVDDLWDRFRRSAL
ncbi:MAG TPA: RIO1 family regulatory kinase/ATPase [Dehalococcoidia bacterium]|nr:RIO1 family regulatory kinase/ATPase [Dehalococcoidia bacterium]